MESGPPGCSSSAQGNASASLLAEAVRPRLFVCVQAAPPPGGLIDSLNPSVVTGATNTQRWPFRAHPSRTLTSTSALSRSKKYRRADCREFRP